MKRRHRHSIIILAITILAIAAMAYFIVIQQQFLPFLVTWAVYCGVLVSLQLLLRTRVPSDRRVRPDPPPEIAAIQAGLRGEELACVVQRMRLMDTKTIHCLPLLRAQRHDLFEASEEFQNGTWTWWVETARKKIVAYAVSFKSHESPTLDKSWGHSRGRSVFLNTSS